MKTRWKIIIVVSFVIILTLLAMSILNQFMHLYVSHYETLGNNEHWYYHPNGYEVECEKRIFDTPGKCTATDEFGNIVATKTEMGNWQNVTVWPSLFQYGYDIDHRSNVSP